MTQEESKVLFTEVKDLLHSNGFETPQGIDSKYNYRDGYMVFNCPHMCSSIRLFKPTEGRNILVEDIRTSFAAPLEVNRKIAINFINKVIDRLNGEDNAVQQSV